METQRPGRSLLLGVHRVLQLQSSTHKVWSHTPQPELVRDPAVDPSTKAAGLEQLQSPGWSGWDGGVGAGGPGHHTPTPQISEVLLQSLQPFGGNAGEGSRATPSTKSPRCHLWLCPSRAQRRGREERRTAFQETPTSPVALTSDRPLRSSVSWPLSTFFSLSMSGPRPPPLAFAPPTALPGAQPPPLRPLPTTARPAQAPAHLPARHAPRQPRPLNEPLGVTWGRA